MDIAFESVQELPSLRRVIKLTAGQKLSDNADVLAFAQKTVPAGKKASVQVIIQVMKLEAA